MTDRYFDLCNSCMKTTLLSAPVGWPVLSSHLCGRCLECTLHVLFMYGSGDTDDTLLKGFVKFKVVCRDLQVYVRHASLVPCSWGQWW